MQPKRLDHVAVYVADPQAAAGRLRSRLPVRVLEETDEFTLVGRRRDLGKVTLFRARGPGGPGHLVRIGIAVPCALGPSRVELGDELTVELVPGPVDGEVDLGYVRLRAPDPRASVASWVELGFDHLESDGDVERLGLGDAVLELEPGDPGEIEHPLLAHLGLLVDSVEEARASAADVGLEVRRFVEAHSSRALFVTGPDGVEVELIEHRPSFALV